MYKKSGSKPWPDSQISLKEHLPKAQTYRVDSCGREKLALRFDIIMSPCLDIEKKSVWLNMKE